MAETRLTVKQILDLGLWEKVCDYKGWDHWILNEGRIMEDEFVTFDSEFKKMDNNHQLSDNNQEELKRIVKRLNEMGEALHPHSAGHIDEAVMLLERYL